MRRVRGALLVLVSIYCATLHAQAPSLPCSLYRDCFRSPTTYFAPDSDITKELQSAIDNCGYFCAIAIPAGSYFISDITIQKLGSLRITGAGEESTVLTYVSNGVAFQLLPQNGRVPIAFGDFKLVALHPGAGAFQLAFFEPATIRNIWLTGFSRNIWLTGDGRDQSVGAWLDDLRIENISGEGAFAISMDHVADVYIDSLQAYAVTDDTSTTHLIIDRGAQGIYINHVVTIGGKHNLVIRSTGQGGDYSILPSAIHCVSSYFDSATGGSAVVFDASLGLDEVRAMFSNCWAGGAGHNSSEGRVVEPEAHGVVIEGGKDIQWNGGVVRQNAGSGVLISGVQPLDLIQFTGARIIANNAGDSPAGSGILVTNPTVTHLSLIGNTIGNLVDGNGHQQYGVSFPNGYSPTDVVLGNAVDGNERGSYNGVPSCLGCGGSPMRFNELPPAPNGTQLFCQDCGVAQPQACINAATAGACTCRAGGTGTFAKRLNNAWLCY
jgi:hypothetical protein